MRALLFVALLSPAAAFSSAAAPPACGFDDSDKDKDGCVTLDEFKKHRLERFEVLDKEAASKKDGKKEGKTGAKKEGKKSFTDDIPGVGSPKETKNLAELFNLYDLNNDGCLNMQCCDGALIRSHDDRNGDCCIDKEEHLLHEVARAAIMRPELIDGQDHTGNMDADGNGVYNAVEDAHYKFDHKADTDGDGCALNNLKDGWSADTA
uniref:EF-hand domain-containing protein n=1 Tax=Calcidiscus leptoporus TaxID=127549 RepID=A0A7S0J318_9EUKA|mmetsp:Transcript_35521/g.82946  ORF Transcript_35521/g.82946 Transcript_35521/m.82946 type:complete len:207 (+) Transcript_35521:30-650(+)